MAKSAPTKEKPLTGDQEPMVQLEQSTYEIIRSRLQHAAGELRARLDRLNDKRREVFGTIPTQLLTTQQVATEHHCIARDLAPVGDRFIFGFNVHLGLKSETHIKDVFAIYRYYDDAFHPDDLSLLEDGRFQLEFQQLYKYYSATQFAKFHLAFPHLYMVFQVGKSAADIKVFKWLIVDGALRYVDNRSEHEVRLPPQHEFVWKRTHRELHRQGRYPHISIEDIVFVECVGGDLTIKIEDNTDDGLGIYQEPVDDPDQTLDDAEIFYAVVGHLLLLKIRPFREQQFRYLIYNRKNHHVLRQDTLEHACLLLPEDHGVVFSNGFYTQYGAYRTFDTHSGAFQFEKRIASSNGEDHLFVFYQPATGDYLLLNYNVIEQRMESPIRCQGFSLYDNGRMLIFRAEESARRHHAIQVWQTPFTTRDLPAAGRPDSVLFKIGNRDVVRGIAECYEILRLLGKEDTYADLYLDLVHQCQQTLDGYFWLQDEAAFDIASVLHHIKQTATAALSEFDKVQSIRAATRKQFDAAAKSAQETIHQVSRRRYHSMEDYVSSLAELRGIRGTLISLKELKYVDVPAVEQWERAVIEVSEKLARQCIEFLAQPHALAVFAERIDQERVAIEHIETAAAGKALEERLGGIGQQLELLIDVVSNLKIDDATQRTAITDSISTTYAALNHARALLRLRLRELLSLEGAAEFAAQLKLLSQAVTSYLDVCDTPDKCDEYLTKMMIQVEEIEGRFAEYDEYIVQLAEKREEISAAFDARKLQLIEARQRRALSLASAADRILNSIQTRLGSLTTLDQINSYFAADLMVEKVRDIVQQLLALNETVKVDELQSRLKTIREDAARQLRDRQDLYVDGQNLIQLGRHQFTVNVQPIDLTMVVQHERLNFHITGTNFFELVENKELDELSDVWDQAIVSENQQVYRGEYLAYLMYLAAQHRNLQAARAPGQSLGLADVVAMSHEALVAEVQHFMAPRYAEGYIKGIHDHDAALILRELATLEETLGWLQYDANSRALANLTWTWMDSDVERREARRRLLTRIELQRQARARMPRPVGQENIVAAIRGYIEDFVSSSGVNIGDPSVAAEFLFLQLLEEQRPAGEKACRLVERFHQHFSSPQDGGLWSDKFRHLPFTDQIQDAMAWVTALDEEENDPTHALGERYEAVSLLLEASELPRRSLSASTQRSVSGMLGDHPRLQQRPYLMDYHEFRRRLADFHHRVVPRYLRFQALKNQCLTSRRDELRLHELKPRVLTSFVRNRLINEVYLPLIGNNLAKQLGAAGEQKRTDRMGLLLVISPPGYGKTTLMEYIANRLGLAFVKINGPALGHQVTSLDPDEAPHASARGEVMRLNLALEMGDNVMIYVDDIQHTNPEFLQKFISLCDATRRIEGVYRGRPKTYDLRGRKVCVVMAGNPYTESGEKFQIPDMLANRADTYNLGDVIGENQELFELSYIENAVTSNPVLHRLANHSWEDVHAVLAMAQGDRQQNVTLRGNYSIEEINEFVTVMRRLLQIRDFLLKINRQYIDSAAQADAFRTEPKFQLQGSYRDMNKLAERVVAMMSDEEIESLLLSHYENQAQTLATGAEANLLKFREISGTLRGDKLERWNDIKRTFQRNLLLGSVNRDDATGQIIGQMALFADGLAAIQRAVEQGAKLLAEPPAESHTQPLNQLLLAQVGQAASELAKLNETLSGLKTIAESSAVNQRREFQEHPSPRQPIHIVNRIPRAFLDVIRHQFEVLERWIEPLQRLADIWPAAKELTRSAKITRATYQKIVEQLSKRVTDEPAEIREEPDA